MTVNYEIGKPREDKRMRITLLLCIGKTKKRIKTDLLATATDINRKGKIRNDSPIYNKVRDKMYAIEKEYAALDTFLTGERINAADAVERMRHTDLPTFFTYAEKWLSRTDIKGKKNYQTAIRSFRAFTNTDIPFSFFSHSLLDDYMYSLHDKPRALTLYVNAIKKIYTDAEKAYDIKPFSTFRIDIPRQKKHRALDADAIRRIFAWKGTGRRAQLARDCVTLSFCLCGTNSADLYSAPPIRNNTLSYNRRKTMDRRADDAHIEIVIPKQIKDLVKRYKGHSYAFTFHDDFCSEASFNRSINIGLKTIGDDLGLKNLTFYAFRHSWATIARNDLKVEKSTIHECLNHVEEDTAIDDIYIKKDFTIVNDANQKVVDFIFSQEEKGDS